jgi:hypothetical protein
MRRTAITIVCLAVIAVAAAAYFTWRRSSTSGPATGFPSGGEASLISQILPGAPYVVYADVAALRNAAFLAKLVAMVPAPAEDPEYTDFVQATGFDYSRDLDRVVISTVADSSAPGTSQSAVWALADGRFDQQKIQAYALRYGKTEQRDGHTVYVIDSTPSSNPSSNEITLRFISPGRIEFVSRPKQAAPGTSASANPPKSNGAAPAPQPVNPGALSDRIPRVSGSAVFAMVRTDSVPKNITIGSFRLDQIVSAIQGVHWLSLSANPQGENLQVVLDGECGSMSESLPLEGTLSGLRALARGYLSQPANRRQFTPQGAAALDKLVKQIDISHDGPHVRLTAVLTPDMLTGFAAPPPNAQPPPARAPNRPASAPKPAPAGH